MQHLVWGIPCRSLPGSLNLAGDNLLARFSRRSADEKFPTLMSGQNWLKPKVPNFAGYLETRSQRGKVPNFNVQPHGLQRPSTAFAFASSMLSINVLRNRKRGFFANAWLLDSAAFTEMSTYGCWRTSPEEYATQIDRLRNNGNLLGAVSQDFMCEPLILQKTGLTVQDHQRLTIDRYVRLLDLTDAYIMPVLQGYSPESHANHLREYGNLLQRGQWAGVGSVSKRSGHPRQIEDVLLAIKNERPDLRLHGFGIKLTALSRLTVRSLLHSADSMAWSYAGRRKRDGSEHDPRLALVYAAKVEPLINQPLFVQQQLFK